MDSMRLQARNSYHWPSFSSSPAPDRVDREKIGTYSPAMDFDFRKPEPLNADFGKNNKETGDLIPSSVLPPDLQATAKMAALGSLSTPAFGRKKWGFSSEKSSGLPNPLYFSLSATAATVIRASSSSQSKADNDNVNKEPGIFALRKKIQDIVDRAEMVTPTALALEEARRIEQEETIRRYNLWDDLAKSNESLIALADTTKAVDALKDLKDKAEEAKLITQLAEMDAINDQLFKQAYDASVDVSRFLDHYEISKLLCGPYDMEGASVTIKAGSDSTDNEMWAEKLLTMYSKWGEKQGYNSWFVEKYPRQGVGIKSATIEFEAKYAYGHLSGERGAHRMLISSFHGPALHKGSLARVDVIPLFLETAPDLQLDEQDLEVSSVSGFGEECLACAELAVDIQHIPTGIDVQCSGERSHFANKMKALNRLKARLLVIAAELGISNIKSINKEAISNMSKQEARWYMFHPQKFVQDVKTGVQILNLESVLNGNLNPFISAHVILREERGIS
ncbi:hypothetical protein ACLOJK_024678 [Asimina triloba]